MKKPTKKPVKSDKVKCTDKSTYFTELVSCLNVECKKYDTKSIQTSIIKDVFRQSNINYLFIKRIDDSILSREAIQLGKKSKISVEKQIQASVMEGVHEQSDINSFPITRSTDPILSRLDDISVLNSSMHNSPNPSGSRSNFNAGCSSRVFIQNHTSSYVERSCDQSASSDIESMLKPESFVDHSENQ
ncbi:hypothetical protein GJ496_004879 [Pomphorhynchus laevis]|nr:hypothetical protein GJ496_004879 [Pomphorhynchus laevis]